MRSLLGALCLCIAFSSSAAAQCYGDAAEAFGCGGSRASQGTLESFGDSRDEVLPDYYGNSRPVSAQELFSYQETMNFYRRLYRGGRGYGWSDQAFRRSMNSQSQPIRQFGNLPFAQPRF
ncbi:MAG: hypothetical protein RL518_10 [Pseudomonadota bacterium]|jgi:hypothetical protein